MDVAMMRERMRPDGSRARAPHEYAKSGSQEAPALHHAHAWQVMLRCRKRQYRIGSIALFGVDVLKGSAAGDIPKSWSAAAIVR